LAASSSEEQLPQGRAWTDYGRFLAALGLLLAADIGFLIALFADVFPPWFEEDGPIENLQVVVLAAAAVVAAWHAMTRQREGRTIAVGLAATFLACCVREIEFRGTPAPEWLIWIFHSTGQNIVIATIFILLAAYAWPRRRQLPAIVACILQRRTAIYLAATLVLLLSSVAESKRPFGTPPESIEEWLELNGYLLLLLAIWFFPYEDARQ
jgi:hypothetical protein